MSAATDYSAFRVTPVTAALGAEIDGIDLKATLSETAQSELRRALNDHLVLFFRDQHIDDAAHLALAECFGGTGGPSDSRRPWRSQSTP